MSYITNMGSTMTTEEFLKLKEQEELDRIFDEAIHEAHQKDLEEISRREHEEYVISLITKLSDLEAELSIVEELHRNSFNKENIPTETINEYKKQLKVLKQKYTKTKNELDRIIENENNIKNNGK